MLDFLGQDWLSIELAVDIARGVAVTIVLTVLTTISSFVVGPDGGNRS